MVALAIPGGWVVGIAILVTSASGAASRALNVYDELEKREPDYAKVAIDVIGIAGGIVGATSGVHGLISAKDMRTRCLDRAGRFYHLLGLATADPGAVMLHFDAVRQLDKALAERAGPAEAEGGCAEPPP